MTILDDLAFLTHTPRASRQLSRVLRRARRLINNAVAAAIAHRQRQADIALLRHLGTRELKDIGLYPSQIEYGLEDAARERRRQQMCDRHRMGAAQGGLER